MAVRIIFVSVMVLAAAQTDLDKPATVSQVIGVDGGAVILPCSPRSSVKQNAVVQLILWFRQDDPSGRPVFSRDARGRGLSSAKVSSAPPPTGFGDRATPDDAGLRLKRLQAEDAAIYRCRVDFSNAPAANHLVNLTIVLPPKSMDILDATEANNGPSTQRALQEGDRLHLMCRVIGGKPKPEVIWRLDGRSIDSSYESLSTDTTVNWLSGLPPLARHHQGKQLECTAKNTELAPPIIKFIIIELLLRPLWTRVISLHSSFVSGQPVTVECRSGGSRPPAQLSWWRGGEKVHEAGFNYSTWAGESVSYLHLSPEPEDDERFLECRAENPAIVDSVVSDRWKMEVQFPASAELRPGAHMRLDSLREGDDAFLECVVKGNPHPTQVKWLHDGVLLVPEKSAGVLRSQFVLVMQRITRRFAGSYSCFVENPFGNSTSNSIHILVQHAPVCATSTPLEVPAILGHKATVLCPFIAHPAVIAVRWQQVQNTSASIQSPHTFSFIPHLEFNKVRRVDLGRYQCWGRNAVGEQTQPCTIDLIAPGVPLEPVNCTANVQKSDLRVTCVPGEPSGPEEKIVMEIISMPSKKTRANVTANWAPMVNLTVAWPPEQANDTGSFENGIFQARIRAVNGRGFGEPFVLNIPQPTTKVLPAASIGFDEPLVAAVLSSTAALLFLTSCTLILFLVIRRRRLTRQRREEAARKKIAARPIVRTPLPRPKVKKVQTDLDTVTPLVDFKRYTLAPSHPTRSLEFGIDQVRYSQDLGTLDRRKDPSRNLIKVKSLESCI